MDSVTAMRLWTEPRRPARRVDRRTRAFLADMEQTAMEQTSAGQRCLDLMAEDVGYGVREAIAEAYKD